MDASTSFGIGIIVEGCVAAWKLSLDWRRPGIDIGWAEMVAVELALTALTACGICRRSVTFRSDNNGVVFALRARRSRNAHQNNTLMRVLHLAETHEIDLQVEYIRSAENPADHPSRGQIPSHLPPIHWPMDTPAELEKSITRII